MKRQLKRIISYLVAFAVLFTSAVPASAYTKPQDAEEQLHSGYAESPDSYEIFPVVQSIVYDGAENRTEFQVGQEVNVVWEDDIDQYTQNFLKEILGNYGRTVTVSNGAVNGKTNILLGIKGSNKAADQYANANLSVQDKELFDKTDSYLLSAKKGSGEEGTIVILGRDTNAVYYGLATLQMMFSSFAGEKFLNAQIEDYASMATRGFIEGFYGGWNYESRESLMRFARDYKMNTYVYASKTDIRHKNDDLYPAAEIESIRKLVEVGKETKVEYAWSIHISYFFNRLKDYAVGSNEYNAKFQENYVKLLAKFQQLYDAGVRKFDILNDDFGAGSLSEVVRLLNLLDKEFIQAKGCRRMSYCPQGYNKAWGEGGYGQYGKEFEALKELNSTIDIYWTGDDVNSPITQDTVSYLKEKTNHAPVFWLNYPVNEHGASGIYLGNITHYARNNVQGLAGAVSNPSRFAETNKAGLFQLAALFWNNTDYESYAQQLWEASFKYLQPEVYDAYFTIAKNVSNCPGSGRVPKGFPESEYLAEKLNSVSAKITDGTDLDGDAEAAELIQEFEHIVSAIQVFRSQCDNTGLVEELDPWLKSLNDIAVGGKEALLSIAAFKMNDTQEAWNHFAAAAKAMETQGTYPTSDGSEKYALAGSKRLEPFVSKAVSEAKKLLVPYLNPNPTDYSLSFYGKIAGVEKSDDAQSAKIFDGDPETFGSYQAVQQLGDYYGVDLGKTVPVHSIDILQGKTDADHDYYHNGCLEYSQNGKDWITIAPNVDTHKLSVSNVNIKARYIRLRLTVLGTPDKKDYWTFIREFTVNGPKGSSFGAYSSQEELADSMVTKEDRSYQLSEISGVLLKPGDYLGIKLNSLAALESIVYEGTASQDQLVLQYSENGVVWTNTTANPGGAKARYVRLLNETGQDVSFDLNKLEITTGDYAISPSVTESSYANLKEGSWDNLFDGDASTYALTNTAQKKDHSIIIDLGSTVPVYDVKITTGDEGPRFYDAKFQISEDKGSWEDFAEVTDGEGDAVRDNIYFKISKDLGGKLGRYIRILITKDNVNSLMINDIEINKTQKTDMPEFTGTLSGDLDKMIDGNISSVYASDRTSDGNDYLEYKLTENTKLKSITILQDSNEVSNAEVKARVYDGTDISEVIIGSLSAGINTFELDSEKDVLSISIKWPKGMTPTIFEIMPVSAESDASGEETAFPQDGKHAYKLGAESFAEITVKYNTAFADLTLPSSTTVTYQDSGTENVSINWSSKGYNPKKAGAYTLKGYPQMPDGAYNHAGLYADIKVTVKDDESGSDDGKYPDVENGNLVLNGQVEESASGLHPVTEAVDGDINTRWEGNNIKGGAATTTSWILADLGNKDISVTQMNIKFYLKTYATNYDIQVSDNKKDWQTVQTKTNPDGDSKDIIGTTTFDTPITQRYVRLFFNSMNANAVGNAVGIREWEVIGSRKSAEPEPDCTCEISGLKLEGQGIAIPADQQSMDLYLDAAAQVTGSCKAEGHDKLVISYLYTILNDTTGGAVLDHDKLTVFNPGEVTIEVTASLTGSSAVDAKTTAVFHVTKDELPPEQTYTASFEKGEGAAGTDPAVITAKAGDEFVLPANTYTKEGYHFTGWSDGSYTYEAGQKYTMPEQNVVFTAQWEEDSVISDCTCQISGLKLEGQNVQIPVGQESIDVILEASAQIIGDCQVPGHDQLAISYAYEITEDQTGSAVINGNQLTLSDAGSVTVKVTAALEGSDAQPAQAEGIVNVTKEEVPPRETYTVSFTGGTDVSGANPQDIQAEAGTQITLPQNPYVKEGYKFVGWSDGSKTYQPSDMFAVQESDVRFIALWEKNQVEPPKPAVYKLSFHANGGTVKTASKAVTDNAAVGTLPVPERKGYTFLGWFTQASGGVQLTEKSIYTFKKDVTVYAHWKMNQPVVNEPARPAGLKAVYNKDKTIKISWKPVQDAKGYIVYRYDSKTGKWKDVKKTSSTSFKNTRLKSATVYKYRVKAYNQSGSVVKEGKVSKTLTTATAPIKTNLTAKRYGSSKVKLTWNKKAKADGFEIYMKTGKKGYARIARKGKNVTTYTKSKLKKGTTYSFRLRSYKKAGNKKIYSVYSKARTIKMK